MNRFSLLGFYLLFSGFLAGQNYSSQYRTRYYYQCPDSISPGMYNPGKNARLLSLLKKKGLIFIDSANIELEIQHGFDSILNITRRTRSAPFFLYQTEVSNGEYKEFFDTMKAPAYYPDTTVWLEKEESDDPFVHYYFQHKTAYKNYPVVGITVWQALQFCAWKEQQLQALLIKSGYTHLQVKVALPTDADWNAAYHFSVVRWLKTQRKICPGEPANSYLRFAMGCGQFRANFASVQTQRMAELKPALHSAGKMVSPCTSYQCTYGVCNLLGNVAEWTATPASGNMFNNLQYIYTTQSHIIRNTQTKIDSQQLKHYLADPDEMKTHFIIKGGSWKDEVFYLQPAAVKYMSRYARSNDVGFRYVVHLVEK